MSSSLRNRQKIQSRRFLPAAGLAFLLMLATDRGMHHVAASSLQALLAIVAGLSFTALLAIVPLTAYLARDEFQRRLLDQSFLWAGILVMTFCAIWGFLQFARFSLPELPLALLPVAFLIVTAAAKLIIFRQNAPGPDSIL